MKSFIYQFYGNTSKNYNANQGFSRSIQVDINVFQTVSDIQKQIAEKLHIKSSQMSIENQPPEALLKNLPNNYAFQISIHNFCPNLDFYFPDGKIIQIKDGYQMNFDQIISMLYNEDIHYSRTCIVNNFCMSISGRKLNPSDFPLFTAQKDTKIKVELEGDIITIDYGENQFTFSENENINDVTSLIQRSFSYPQPTDMMSFRPNNSTNITITILNDQNRIISNRNEVIKPFINYTVHADCNFIFRSIKQNTDTNQCMDHFSTVFDAQKRLAVMFCYYNNQLINNTNQTVNRVVGGQPAFTEFHGDDSLDEEELFDDPFAAAPKPINLDPFAAASNPYNLDPIASVFHAPPKGSIAPPTNQYIQLRPENFIIYDSNRKKIENLDDKLINIQSNQQYFYYDVTFDEKLMIKPGKKAEPEIGKHDDSDTKSKKLDDPTIKLPLKKKEDDEAKEEKDSARLSKTKSMTTAKKKSKISMPKITKIMDDDNSKNILKIKFYFEKTNPTAIKPFEKELPLKMTINDIKNMISEKYDIDDKIQVKYKFRDTKITIDDDMNLEDVKDDIKEKDSDGKTKNILYVQIIPSKTKEIKIAKKYERTFSKDEEFGDEYHIQILSTRQIDEFTKQKMIGTGATSKVIKVSHIYALKIFNEEFCKKAKNEEEEEEDKKEISDDDDKEEEEDKKEIDIDIDKMKLFFKEYEIIMKLNHPNIIKTFGICFGDKKHNPSILLEYCPYTLKSCIKTLSNEERIQIIIEIIEAMKHVHSTGMIHRDLKPENILLDNDKHVRLSDFGLCRIVNTEKLTQSLTDCVGTRPFMAPELVTGSTDYTNKIDVYAFGVVVYVILAKGKYPNIKFFDVGLGKKAKIPSNFSQKAKEMINNCW